MKRPRPATMTGAPVMARVTRSRAAATSAGNPAGISDLGWARAAYPRAAADSGMW
ncbi:MAG TPA: hypothetical protein VN493_11235 [Thermoanaerobaculia bacterium]|nr:hypothetical protein [Thermoanaerobaculia bacterium]